MVMGLLFNADDDQNGCGQAKRTAFVFPKTRQMFLFVLLFGFFKARERFAGLCNNAERLDFLVFFVLSFGLVLFTPCNLHVRVSLTWVHTFFFIVAQYNIYIYWLSDVYNAHSVPIRHNAGRQSYEGLFLFWLIVCIIVVVFVFLIMKWNIFYYVHSFFPPFLFRGHFLAVFHVLRDARAVKGEYSPGSVTQIVSRSRKRGLN